MNEKQAIELLKKYSKGNKEIFNLVLKHSKAVQKIALDLAENTPNINIELIKTGSLLHDVGRFDCKPKTKLSIEHGIKGAEILKKEGFPELAKIAETHIGAGITKQDIEEQNLNLPKKDFIPKTKEEKIIACADNLTRGETIISIEQAEERFTKEVSPKIGKRIKGLYDEIISQQQD